VIDTSGQLETLPARRLAPFTSLRVGGDALHFLATRDVARAAACAAEARRARMPLLFLGGGSNLLISDRGIAGLVLRYEADGWSIDEADGEVDGEVDGEASVRADAGVPIAKLARMLAKQGWSGLEWASNVPGTIGGAVVNNAGAFGGDMAAGTLSVEALDADGRLEMLYPADLAHGYRTSALKHVDRSRLVTGVRYRLHRDRATDCVARVREYQDRRTATQPREQSAGSVFANPEGDYAGRLIEEAGLKGRQIGGARISERHANFIVNTRGATARDVFELMTVTQQTVWDRRGIWLRPEIELAGDWTAGELAQLQPPPRPLPPRTGP
jgi:UDP-N-acetylmuramate dehydrogenase